MGEVEVRWGTGIGSIMLREQSGYGLQHRWS